MTLFRRVSFAAMRRDIQSLGSVSEKLRHRSLDSRSTKPTELRNRTFPFRKKHTGVVRLPRSARNEAKFKTSESPVARRDGSALPAVEVPRNYWVRGPDTVEFARKKHLGRREIFNFRPPEANKETNCTV